MTKKIQIIPKDLVFPEAIVLNKEYKELYEEVFAKTAEKYGKNSLAYQTITNKIDSENVTGSQFFFNTELGTYLPKNQSVINLEDIDKILNINKNFFNDFYTDTPQIVLRSNQLSYDKNQFSLKDLIKQLKNKYEFSPGNPLVLTNLELVQDKKNSDKAYGLLLKIGENTKLQNDKRLAHGNNKIQLGNLEKNLHTKGNGLSGVYLPGYGDLNTKLGNLDNSNGSGRVVLMDSKNQKLSSQ